MTYPKCSILLTVELGPRANARQKNKFNIKVWLSSNESQENRQETIPKQNHATEVDVLVIGYMVKGSLRLKDPIERKGINNEQAYGRHLTGYNVPVTSSFQKTALKQILQTDKRLGKNLKGINESNLQEIENGVWSIGQREAGPYLRELDYQRQKKQLMGDIYSKKQHFIEYIQILTQLKDSNHNNFMLTSIQEYQ